MELKTTADIVNFILAISSFVTSAIAIVLSIYFYKWSNDASANLKENSEKIGSAVDSLAAMLSRVDSGLLNFVTEQNKDMFGIIARGSDTMLHEKAKPKLAEVASSVATELEALKNTTTPQFPGGITGQVRGLVAKAIRDSEQVLVETKHELLVEAIFQLLRSAPKGVELKLIVGTLNKQYTGDMIAEALTNLCADSMIRLTPNKFEPDTVIRIAESVAS